MARCVPAPACKAMRAEASRRWPMRNQASDGICPSAAHSKASPTSDHERGQAVDITHDPAHGVDCNVLAELVKDDPRVKYVIWNRRIYNPSVSRTWRRYSGSNAHTKHMHVSIKASARDDTSPWFHHLTPKPQEDDDMTDDERKMLSRIHHEVVVGEKGDRPETIAQLLERIDRRLAAVEKKVGA